MKKILVYHLYVNDTITDNKSYKLHQCCLQYYKHMFDEMIICIAVNDIKNKNLIKDATKWVVETCEGKIFTIKVKNNTYLGETKTFKEEILNKRKDYKDSFVFFAHSKNATRLSKTLDNIDVNDFLLTKPKCLIFWCIALYFYGLNFKDELEKRLIGYPRPNELFYGPILTQLNNPELSPMFKYNKGNCYYQGTFFWINMNQFNNYIDNSIVSLPEIDCRYWTEMLPGVMGGRFRYGDGCASHNDMAITDDFNLYKDEEKIDELVGILGDSEEFWEFYNNIINKVNN